MPPYKGAGFPLLPFKTPLHPIISSDELVQSFQHPNFGLSFPARNRLGCVPTPQV